MSTSLVCHRIIDRESTSKRTVVGIAVSHFNMPGDLNPRLSRGAPQTHPSYPRLTNSRCTDDLACLRYRYRSPPEDRCAKIHASDSSRDCRSRPNSLTSKGLSLVNHFDIRKPCLKKPRVLHPCLAGRQCRRNALVRGKLERATIKRDPCQPILYRVSTGSTMSPCDGSSRLRWTEDLHSDTLARLSIRKSPETIRADQ